MRRILPAGIDPVIRFKSLEGPVIFEDPFAGESISATMSLMTRDRQANGMPTYNFAVVVDDMDMGITHVIRGDDHVNNTPRQVNIFNALNASLPVLRMCR